MQFSLILPYVAPPVLGGFIGYLTNKVAIKMLFRPLTRKHIMGVRIPMTPGVIPSKRAELAVNIGEMVGSHLLTSHEIGRALERDSFQKTLLDLIAGRGEDYLGRDLGTLADIIPETYRSYYKIAVQVLIDQARKSINSFIDSDAFQLILDDSLDDQFGRLLAAEMQKFLPGEDRESIYRFIECSLARMTASPAMAEWVESFVRQKVYESLARDKSLSEIIPEEMQEFVLTSIEKQTPQVLAKVAEVLAEPEVRDRLVTGVRMGIESFVAGLGPMAAMVAGFLTPEVVEDKVRKYLIEKEDDIVNALQDENIQKKVADALRERSMGFLTMPLSKIVGQDNDEIVETFCKRLSEQFLAFMREPETSVALSSMVRDNIETHIEGGALSLGEILFDFVGDDGIERMKQWLKNEVSQLLHSAKTRKILDSMVETLMMELLSRRIGKVSRLLPAGVRDGIYLSLRNLSLEMLAVEVPGLVGSLNIQKIVRDKVDSLDLLRLEQLLLSIMEEQFKYINLFGGLLGFLIGCLNLFFLNVI